jgi:hypothetical protein
VDLHKYNWNLFYTVAAGTYNVTVKNTAGCISDATSVTINATTNYTGKTTAVTLLQPTCDLATGEQCSYLLNIWEYLLSIDGTTSYKVRNWNTAVAAGTYSVTVKNTAGCISDICITAQPKAPVKPTVTLFATNM